MSDQRDLRSHLAAHTETVFLAVASVLVFVNLVPALLQPFYQDDFHFMWLFQSWGGDYGAAMRQEGFPWGFRPLGYVLRLFFWNVLGENAFTHHLIIVLAYLLVGAMVSRAAWRLGGSKLHGALGAMLFFASIIPRRWVYSWVAFNPADVAVLLSFLLVLESAFEEWSPGTTALWLFGLGVAGLLMKENAVAAPFGVVLIALLLRGRFDLKTLRWIVLSQVLVLVIYGSLYASLVTSRPLTVEQTTFSVSQLIDVLRGFVYAVGAPLTSLYLSLRKYGFDVGLSALTAGVGAAAALWLVVSANGGSLESAFQWVRKRSVLIGASVTLVALGVVPYLPGSWFEMRMIVVSLAIGTVMWACLLGDALHGLHGWRRWRIGAGLMILMAGFAAGAPLSSLQADPNSLDAEVETGVRMREFVEAVQRSGIRQLCLFGFPSQNGALRAGNALSLARYEAGDALSVTHDSDTAHVSKVMADRGCASVVYDVDSYHPTPLRVMWPHDTASSTAPPAPRSSRTPLERAGTGH